MVKSTPKSSDTSMRVLETLKLLVKHDSSIQDIINYFEKIDPHNKTYTNEAILKYINMLKVFGFKIIKIKDKYSLLNMPKTIDFSEEELCLIKEIEDYSNILPERKVKIEIDKFLQNLEKYFSQETINIINKTKKTEHSFKISYQKYDAKIKLYEKFCLERQKIKVIYWQTPDAKNSIVVEPKGIKYKDNRVYFSVYNPLSAQIQDINFDNIIDVMQLPIKSNSANILSSVTFRLKDRLAKSYNLHEGERLVDMESEGNILVMNQTEDKELLLRRLMRYGAYCEVVTPKRIREDMKNMIKNTLDNYK